MAANMMMDDIEKLNRIILLLEDREFSTAKGIAIVWRDKLQGELDTMNSYYENSATSDLGELDEIQKDLKRRNKKTKVK